MLSSIVDFTAIWLLLFIALIVLFGTQICLSCDFPQFQFTLVVT